MPAGGREGCRLSGGGQLRLRVAAFVAVLLWASSARALLPVCGGNQNALTSVSVMQYTSANAGQDVTYSGTAESDATHVTVTLNGSVSSDVALPGSSAQQNWSVVFPAATFASLPDGNVVASAAIDTPNGQATTGTLTINKNVNPPGPVTNLMATGGTGQVTLGWTNPTDADFVATRILQSPTAYATSPMPAGDQVTVFDGSGTSTVATEVTASTTYFYTAFTRDSAGNWSSSTTAQATTNAAPPPPAPPGPVTHFVATGGTGQVSLSWSNPTDTSFAATRILQSPTAFATSATPSGDQVTVYEGAGTSTVVSNLMASTTYYYTAFTRDAAGDWGTAVTAQAMTNAAPPPTPPGPVTNFVAMGGSGQVSLSWTNPTDASFAATRILQSPTAYASSPMPVGDQVTVYEGAATSTVATGLTAGTTYYYTAFTRDAAGDWGMATTAQATTSSTPPPSTNVNFVDSFSECTSTTDIGPNWTIFGTWYCKSGKARGESANGLALAKTDTMAGTDVVARVQFASQTLGNGGVAARVTSGNASYYAARALAAGKIQVIRVNGTTVTVLGEVSATVSAEPSSYKIELRVSGTTSVQLDCWFNGSQVLSVQDTSPQAIPSGQAGLYNGANSRTQFSNFSVVSF